MRESSARIARITWPKGFARLSRDFYVDKPRETARKVRSSRERQERIRDDEELAKRAEPVAYRACLAKPIHDLCVYQRPHIVLQHASAPIWDRLCNIADH